MNTRCEPSQSECLRALGLPPDATWRQIKRAYRRLALRYHPDRNRRAAPGDGPDQVACRAMFHLVTRAYAVLERDFQGQRHGGQTTQCTRCGDVEPLRLGLDGNQYCRTCLTLAEGKRALPGPPVVVVGLGLIAADLAVSAASLAVWTASGWQACWWTSVGTCVAAVGALAAICLCVQYAAEPRPHRIRPARTARWLGGRWKRG